MRERALNPPAPSAALRAEPTPLASAMPQTGAASPAAPRVREVATGHPAPLPQASTIALPVLLQLRWLAIAGQSALLLLAYGFGADLPYGIMWALVGVALISNLALQRVRLRLDLAQSLPLVLTLDTLLLTCLLALSGGPHNPFTALYVVHVALGAVASTLRGTAWIAALSGIGYAAMFRWHVPLDLWHGGMGNGHAGHGESLGAHLVGMWVALAIVAATIAYFITRLVEQLATARARAARNERLASLTTLAAGAAHELGSPLGTIAVASTEIARESSGAVRDDALLIRAEVQRCRSILDRMSGSVSAPAPLHERATSAAIAQQVLENLRERATRVRIEWTGRTGTRRLPSEPLEQALTTLLRNALDASDTDVWLRGTEARAQLTLEVLDRGCGMPEDVLARLGEPFVTTKDPGQGTGLGIYVVRLIAERLGGTLTFQSSQGAGTSARLTIPLGDSSDLDAAPLADPAPAADTPVDAERSAAIDLPA